MNSSRIRRLAWAFVLLAWAMAQAACNVPGVPIV
jgi:hypothetical protein